MKLEIKREPSTDVCTIGIMTVNGRFQCYTLEDVVRDQKIPGETAIPAGVYKVIITYSNRFKRDLPLLVNVENFSGVRIHPGNTAADTEGCILVGQSRTSSSVQMSRTAFGTLYSKLLTAWAGQEEIWLKVS